MVARDAYRAWMRLVAGVERGYAWSIFEYENDLGCRRTLEEEIQEGRTFDFDLSALAAWDERFREATRPMEDAADEWDRLPILLVGALKEDVESGNG